MTRRLRPLWLLLPALALVAADRAAVAPDELVRRGNDAVARKQYDEALKLYDRAEDRATDPGLVAFNEGVAFYEQGDYARAEAHFRLARQDAAGRRRLWASYNLAASLLQTAGERDVAKLAEAVNLFDECLGGGAADERLALDARHNLELAKMLWVQAKARPAPPQDRPPNDPDNPPPPPKPEKPQQQPGGAEEGPGNPDKGQRVRTAQEQGQEPIKTGDQAPGEGDLKVIPDRDELVPMTKEEAEAHLRQAVERVIQEGRAHRQRSPRVTSGKVRDW
jgi:tetratricopeptide (TPR) repeat protein